MNHSTIVTAIGSFSADCVINTLHSLGWKVYGTDIYPKEWHYEASLCDGFFQAPLATDQERYISFMIDCAQKVGADSIIPLTDLEIDIIDRHRERFVEKGITLLMQSHEVLKVARDKYELFLRFKNNPLFCVPSTYSTPISVVQILDSNTLPLIAKPRDGRSSEGLVKVLTLEQLSSEVEAEGRIIQEFRSGPVFTVDYVRDLYGNDMAVARQELLRTKNGAGMTVEITPDPLFAAMTSDVGQNLGIVGCVNMEFILSEGHYYLIDLNPRFSAGVAFSRLAGYDMVSANMNAFMNEKVPPCVALRRSIMQKKHVEVVNALFP